MLTLTHAANLGFSAMPGAHHDEAMCPSEMPPPAYTGPVDYVIDGSSTSCLETEINCFNRYSPYIPMAMTVPSGSVVEFHTRDLWDRPGWDRDSLDGKPDADVNFDKAYGDLSVVHIITGPVGVEGAEPGDKIRIDILDIKPLDKGFTMADTPLGFMDNVQTDDQPFGTAFPPGADSYRAWCWWDHTAEGWTSPTFPDVVVPYEPFPGSIGVLPSLETVNMKLEHHAAETELYGGPAWAINPEMAVPASVCGAEGTNAETCLRTLAGGDYFGNTDTQRMGIGTSLYLECQVAGCGVGTGDTHGAQGDGEISITAIEMEAAVTMKLTLIKAGELSLPTPAMVGGASIKRMSPGEFVSFMGFPFKESGSVPSQYRWAIDHAQALIDSKIIPESMSLAGANALQKALVFLMDAGGYTYGEAMMLASVTVDLRVAQLVDKPAVGMEAIVDLTVFKGAKYEAMKAAAGM